MLGKEEQGWEREAMDETEKLWGRKYRGDGWSDTYSGEGEGWDEEGSDWGSECTEKAGGEDSGNEMGGEVCAEGEGKTEDGPNAWEEIEKQAAEAVLEQKEMW